MNLDLLFQKAKQKGIEDVQAFLSHKNELSIEVFNGDLDKYEISDSSSLIVRGIYQGKFGTFVTEVMDDSIIDLIIDNMIANAKIIDSPDEAIIYAGDKKYEIVEGLFEEALEKKDAAEKIAAVKELDGLLHKADPRVSIAETMYSETTRTVLLQNTKGLKLYNKVNSAYLGAQVIVKDEADQRTGFDLDITNDFADFNLSELADRIVKEGIDALGAKPIASNNYEIILRRDALAILLATFQNVFSADAVQKGLSLLKGKLSETIGSELVTIVDDPFLKKSSSSRSFDDEGCATKYKELIKNGVLTTYLHNLNTAKKDGLSTTGNGFSGSVSFINMKMISGNDTMEAMLASIKDGLLITNLQGSHAGANTVSGDFSLQASGFVIKDGKIGAPVALVTVAGNFISLLKDIVAVGDDSKTSFYGVTCPSVKVKSMPVSGL
ncbi:MAG: TldD/PmbA family protein [Candidatus Izemoplasmatales bacterium]|nr:TldD/PmbA family protein [Candidatus Izemoplasmatales bacterium]MDD3865726.1 TldD/PmbA family protein [Candidatus Izemoplasmatales bacterium]